MEQPDYIKDQPQLVERLQLLQELHEKKLLLRKKILYTPFAKPLNVEVLGTPGAGKSECVSALSEFFRRGGFNVYVASEAIDHVLYDDLNVRDDFIQKTLAERMYMLYLQISNCTAYDVVLYDAGILDRYIWQTAFRSENKITPETLEDYRQLIADQRLDYTAGLMCCPSESKRRSVAHSLALEPKYGYALPDLYSYNAALGANSPYLSNHSVQYHLFETDRQSLDDINLQVANEIVELGLKR